MSARIALAQVNPCVGDLAGNADLIVHWAHEAAQAGADVAVFPEMVLTGYPIEDLALRRSFQQASAEALSHVAARLADEGMGQMAVVVGSLGTTTARARRRGEQQTSSLVTAPTNIAALLREGHVEAVYTKQILPNYGVFDEERIFEPGADIVTFEAGGAKFGIAICEDIWQQAGPIPALVSEKCDALLVLNASPFEVDKYEKRIEVASARAAELHAPVVYVNMCGAQDELIFDGASFVVSPKGKLLSRAPLYAPRRSRISELSIAMWELGTDDEPAPTRLPREGLIWHGLVTGLKNYVEKNGFSSVCLGLSGGIDSAVVAVLAADAIGGENVYGVSMPSRYSSDGSKDDAAELAERIGAHYEVQAIEPFATVFDTEMSLGGVAAENLQARLRGIILMALSNAHGHLVLATGNKSELATGYSTIYGDAVGGFAPLKDVLKTMVWDLARWRNDVAIRRGKTPPIPENSITKPPSAELRPDQTDQDSLPDYPVLDAILVDYVEKAMGHDELIAAGHPADLVDQVIRLCDGAEWKRRQYPPGPKISGLAFGRDRRLPITTRWREK